jgi:hypothetical protein
MRGAVAEVVEIRSGVISGLCNEPDSSVATTHHDCLPLASARSGQCDRMFMITGFGVHDRTD